MLLRRCLDEHPGYLGSVLPLADAMLRRGATPEEVIATIEAGVEEMTPSVRFMIATALYEAGSPEVAEPLYRAVTEAQPDNGFARLALAETLLSTRRYAEAAAAAAAVAEDAGCAAAAARSELFALLLAGEPGAAAIERARRRRPERRRPRPLRRLERGRAGGRLPAARRGLRGDRCRRCWRRCCGSRSSRPSKRCCRPSTRPGCRAAGATRCWPRSTCAAASSNRPPTSGSSACELLGPDAEALTGLAQVARARGFDEDAAVFADQARELESSSR